MQVFPGKHSKVGIAAYGVGLLLSALLFALALVSVGERLDGNELAFLAAAAGSFLLLVWFLVVEDYRVTEDRLLIRQGPFRFRVRLDRIRTVIWSDDRGHPYARPQLPQRSLIVISAVGPYEENDHAVSPRDPEGFVTTLLAGNSGIVLGDGVPGRRHGRPPAPPPARQPARRRRNR